MALTQIGLQGYQQGAIYDQTLLLQDIRDGLVVYNKGVLPVIDQFSETTVRQWLRVSQAPKDFSRSADGGMPENSRMIYRILSAPLKDYDLASEFTVKWLQDALPSDIINEINGALTGDVALNNSLFFQAIFLPQTATTVAYGSSGSSAAAQAGFYNGELDVPPYKNNTFSAAHYHYLGTNTTNITLAVWRSAKQNIQEHGYGLQPGELHAYCNSLSQNDIMSLINSNTTILQAITGQREKAIDNGVFSTNIMIEGVVVHFDDNVPAGYFCMLATDVKPIIRRVHMKPEYQGLQMYSQTVNETYPLAGMQFLRRIGFAVQFLGAGAAYQVVASTAYTTPTFRLG